ncbi:MAG: Gfo/Idh/MocA family oxidoreductase [Caldilineaceae bacterium]
MKPIQLGVIGLGLIWQRAHQPVLAELPELIQPVAFCDLSEARRAATREQYPNAPVVDSADALLAQDGLDAVLVLTPIALNAPTALKCIQAGKHVFMEKPIARTLTEGQALIAAARQANRNLYVLEQMGYRPLEMALLEALAAGEIGELLLWERVQHLEADTAQGALRYDSTPWRKQANFPLGTLFDGGIHLIAGLSRVFGRPQSVEASGRRLREEYGDYDQVTMNFRYANGVSGLLSHSAYLPPVRNFFYIHGTAGVITVERNQFTIEKPDQPARVVEFPAENPYAGMWRQILRAYSQGGEAPYSAQDALRDVAILLGVERSIKSGERVAVS